MVNGDTAGVVSGTPSLSTTATIVSPNGQYPIAITAGTLSAANYDFITVGGILTVADTPATTITLTASPGSTSTYGQALTFTATVSPTDSGDPTPTGTVGFEIDGTPIGSAYHAGQWLGHERRPEQSGRRQPHHRGHLLW